MTIKQNCKQLTPDDVKHFVENDKHHVDVGVSGFVVDNGEDAEKMRRYVATHVVLNDFHAINKAAFEIWPGG